MFCHVHPEQVFGVHDVTSVYHVPLLLQSQGIVEYLRKRLNLTNVKITKEMCERGANLAKRWKELTTGCAHFFQVLRSDGTELRAVQPGTIIRHCHDCPCWQIHRPQGFVYVCYKSPLTFSVPGTSQADC